MHITDEDKLEVPKPHSEKRILVQLNFASALDSGGFRPQQIALTSKLTNAVDAHQKVDNGPA